MSKIDEIKQLLNDRTKFTERMESTDNYNLAHSSVIRLQSIDERIALLVPGLLEENERLRKDLEELRNINEGIRRVATYWHESFVEARKIILPRQPDRQGGWDIDFNFLQKVQQIIDIKDEDRQFDHIVLEEIQVTLLALEKVIDQGKLPTSNPDEVQISCMDFELIKK